MCISEDGHLGVASTMATLKEKWYMIHMRAQVKKQIRKCNICKVFSMKPFKGNMTAPLPKFRTTCDHVTLILNTKVEVLYEL